MVRIKLLSVALLILLSGLSVVITAPSSTLAAITSWWDNSWSRRAEVTITENSGSTLTDYQVKVIVPYDSDMQADFDDIRFVANDGTTELSHWRESYSAGSSVTFWVKVPSIAASGIEAVHMYYGNPGAASASNIHSTFIWGDDFENPTWTSSNIHQVNYDDASQYIQNGQYHQEGVARSEPIAEIYESGSLKPFPPNYVAEVEILPVIQAGGAFICPRYDSVMDKYESLIDIQEDGACLNKVVDDAWTNILWQYIGYTIEAGSWYRLKAVTLDEGSTNRLQVHINDTLYVDQTDPDLSYPGLAFLSYDWNDPFHVAYDNFRVRQYASQEPTNSIGPEEQQSGNRPPVLDPIGDKSVNVGVLLQFTVLATDPDGDPLTYSADNLPSGASFDPGTRTFSWTPSSGQAGTYPNVQFQVSDGALTDSENITITVLSPVPQEILKAIASGPDDGFSGVWAYVNSSTWYEVGNPGATYDAWFRFTGVTIPTGSTILQAHLETIHGNWTTGTHLKIRAEKATNPSAPASTADHTSRTRTTAGVDWDTGFADWYWHNSPDFAQVIQELVDTYDYSNGDHVILILVDDDGSENGKEHEGSTFEGGFAPRLYIKYVEATTP